MNAPALALPRLSPVPAPQTPLAPAAGLALHADNCVEQTALLLRLACRRGQFEDASAAARVALPLAVPDSPHAALLGALAAAQPTLLVAPEESRLYLLRRADGTVAGQLRLRDNGRLGLNPPAGLQGWTLRDGCLDLLDPAGHTGARFTLCGHRDGRRLYLGQTDIDGAPLLLQEQGCTFTRLGALDPELAPPFCSLFDADALVLADLPASPALLLGATHSGTTRLAALLNQQAGVFFDGELLHPQAIRLAEGAVPAAAAATLHTLRAKDPAWFARVVMGREHDSAGRDLAAVPVRGFTLAPQHSGVALDWAIAEPALRIVFVTRSNLLAAFADSLGDQPGQAGQPPLHFEAERFGRFVEMSRRAQDALRERLVQRNADTVEVDGSRLNAATLHELMGFLTDTAPADLPAPAAPTAPAQRVIERFDNPDLVAACLAALGRPGWAEVEGSVPDPQ